MKAVTKVMIGAAGIVALGAAAPASAQYNPGYGYGYGYGSNNPANVIGQVLGTILNPYAQNQYGYGYGMNPQMAAQRCSTAVQHRLSMRYQAGYGGYGYNSGYSNARVLGITSVEPRSRTTTRVRGHATSGMNYGGYGYGYGGYNSGADLTFKCDIDYRGNIRDIDIDRRY